MSAIKIGIRQQHQRFYCQKFIEKRGKKHLMQMLKVDTSGIYISFIITEISIGGGGG